MKLPGVPGVRAASLVPVFRRVFADSWFREGLYENRADAVVFA